MTEFYYWDGETLIQKNIYDDNETQLPEDDFTIESQTVKGLAKNQESPELGKINEFCNKVVTHYAGDWAKFFLEFKVYKEQSFNQIKQQNRP